MNAEVAQLVYDTGMYPEERLVETLVRRAKQGRLTPDSVVMNYDEWCAIARRTGGTIHHENGGKTFEDRWLFLVTVAGPFRLFASMTVEPGTAQLFTACDRCTSSSATEAP